MKKSNDILMDMMDKADHISENSHLGNLEIHFQRSVRQILNHHGPLEVKAKLLSTFSNYINIKLENKIK